MSIVYDPDSFIKKIAPARKIEKLLKKNLTVKKASFSFLDEVDFIDKKDVVDVALKVSKNYRERFEDAADEGLGSEVKAAIVDDPKLLIQRVQSEIVFQVHEKIKGKYGGERAVWLPSSADEPRPEHQLNYGKEYTIGEGIDGIEPGDEYGCQCGVEILVDQDALDL